MSGYIEDKTQEQVILDILLDAAESGVGDGWVDGMKFLRLSRPITQYHARIFGLQEKGWEIEGRRVEGKNWKEYRVTAWPEEKPAISIDL